MLSGGIGSGKSAVRRFLEANGVHTIDADSVGHEVLSMEGAAYPSVAARWPETVTNGEIDRSVLAGIVFSDKTQLQALETMTHPHIFGIIRERAEGFLGPVVVEIPVLNHGLGPGYRRIVVDSADETRLQRLLARGMSEDDAVGRMASQPTRGEWLAAADLVVPNHGDHEELEKTVTILTERLLR